MSSSSSPAPPQQSSTLAPPPPQRQQHIILFYRYHPLTSDTDRLEVYRLALERLCTALALRGRILVGASTTEGINGTLAGYDVTAVRAFTWALLGREDDATTTAAALEECSPEIRQAVELYWTESTAFRRI